MSGGGQALAAPQMAAPPRLSLPVVVIAIIILGTAAAWLWPPLQRWPAAWSIPFRDWVTQGFVWFSATAKPVTRALSWLLSWPLWFSEALLFRGFPALNLPQLPWIALVGGTVILGHWAGGRGLAIFCGLSAFYLAKTHLLRTIDRKELRSWSVQPGDEENAKDGDLVRFDGFGRDGPHQLRPRQPPGTAKAVDPF